MVRRTLTKRYNLLGDGGIGLDKQDYNKINYIYLEENSDVVVFVDKDSEPFHTMEYRKFIELVHEDKEFAEKVKPFWT